MGTNVETSRSVKKGVKSVFFIFSWIKSYGWGKRYKEKSSLLFYIQKQTKNETKSICVTTGVGVFIKVIITSFDTLTCDRSLSSKNGGTVFVPHCGQEFRYKTKGPSCL